MGMILNALGALVIGAVGWFTLEFIGRPVRSFFDLRRRVRKEMLQFEHVALPMLWADDGLMSPGDAAIKKEAGLRELSAELISFGQSEGIAAELVKRLGFRPVLAGHRLANLASEGGTMTEDRSANYRAVLEALKYPVAMSARRNPPSDPGAHGA